MIIAITICLILLTCAGIFLCYLAHLSQRAQNKYAETTRFLANAAHTRLDQFPRIEISCEAIVCGISDCTYTVMFANIHHPELARRKQAYTMEITRLPNEPCFIGQVRVFNLTCFYSHPPTNPSPKYA